VAEEESGHSADEDHGKVALFALDGHALLPLLVHQAESRFVNGSKDCDDRPIFFVRARTSFIFFFLLVDEAFLVKFLFSCLMEE